MRSLYPKCRKLAESEAFQSVTLLFILLMAAAMGLDTVPELSENREAWFTGLELVAQGFFVFEIAVRILASGPKLFSFFRSKSNAFDFAVVILSLLPGVGPLALLARLFRVLRVLRVFTASDRMRAFFERLNESLDEIACMGVILLVGGYVFTLAGFYLFGGIDPGRWGSFTAAARTLFYLALLQDVPPVINPLLVTSRAFMLYFVMFYFAMVSVLLASLAAMAQEPNRAGAKRAR